MQDEPSFRRRPGERAPEILDAAMALFAERGFERTRIVDIAKRAGVSHGTVGIYFPTKEALLHGVVERMAEPEMERVEALIGSFPGTTAELLETLGSLWWEQCQEEQTSALMRVVEAELGNYPELAETFRNRIYDPVISLFVRVFERGAARGEYLCDDPDPYAELAFGGLSHVVDWNAAMGKALDRRVDARRYIQLWARSIACALARNENGEGATAEQP